MLLQIVSDIAANMKSKSPVASLNTPVASLNTPVASVDAPVASHSAAVASSKSSSNATSSLTAEVSSWVNALPLEERYKAHVAHVLATNYYNSMDLIAEEDTEVIMRLQGMEQLVGGLKLAFRRELAKLKVIQKHILEPHFVNSCTQTFTFM